MSVKEAQDAPPGVLRGGGVIAEPGGAHERALRSAIVGAEERMPGCGILVDIVLDAFAFKRCLRACGRRSRYAVGAAVAGDDRTSAAQRLSGGYGIRACRIVGAEAWKPRVAASSAKPPPMQKPATPTRPV